MVQSRWIPGARSGLGDGPSISGTQPNSQASCLREFTLIFRNREKVANVYEPLEDLEREGMRAIVLWMNFDASTRAIKY